MYPTMHPLTSLFNRMEVMAIALALHVRGVQHNDLYPRNIVVDNIESPQRVVIIDFGLSTPHECQRQLDLAIYLHPPNADEFGCDEIYHFAMYTEIWTPSIVFRAFPRLSSSHAVVQHRDGSIFRWILLAR